jgi:Nucleotide modification associated domain 3
MSENEAREMQVVLLRVGIDSGAGGMQGPLFEDGSFEFVPIPDRFHKLGENSETYGRTTGRSRRLLLDYFPEKMRAEYRDVSIHADPEFETFTYGDPTKGAKRGLRKLRKGDLLVFYAGLEPWPRGGEQRLYIVGYFNVCWAGLATDLNETELATRFHNNFHVKHKAALQHQRGWLVLVQGDQSSKLLRTAVPISAYGRDKSGRRLKVLSEEMQAHFGDFDGRIAIQRSAPRWVHETRVAAAADFVRSFV